MTDREVPVNPGNSKTRGAAESRIERLKAGLALEQEREQDGTNLYTEMYENVLDYKSMRRPCESLKSAETGKPVKVYKGRLCEHYL